MEVFVSVYSVVLISLLHRKTENQDKIHFCGKKTKNEKSNTR